MTLPLIVGTAPGFSWILFRGAKLCWSKWALQSLAPGLGLQPGFRQQNRIHFLRNVSLRGNLNRFILLPQDFKLHCGIFDLNSEIKFLDIFKLYMIPDQCCWTGKVSIYTKEYVLVIESTVPRCVFQQCVSQNLFLLVEYIEYTTPTTWQTEVESLVN